MVKCIYCLQEKKASDFNREHVVPESFGRYTNNLVIRFVCAECNCYFGKTTDRILARDSWEGLNRYLSGVKPLDEISNFANRRVVVTFAKPGEWHGVKLRLTSDSAGPVVELVPQVGMLDANTRKWIFYTLEELDSLPHKIIDTIRNALELKIFFPDEAGKRQVIDALANKQITFEQRTTLPPIPLDKSGYGEVDIRYSFDLFIHRAMSKIAFNYLAWHMGRDFTHRSDFDDARNFVRYGTLPESHIVRVTSTPILSNDSVTVRQTDGHIIILNWARATQDIVSKVSLFNHLTYEVVLARYYSGPWRPDLRIGRLFDHRRRAIIKVHAADLLV